MKGKGIPIWFMRQAGRYLPEYRKVMENITNFFDACYNPQIVEEITLQPIKRFDLDAAIIFSDIMVVPDALGFNIEFLRGQGPVIKDRTAIVSVAEALHKLEPIFTSIKNVRKSLPEHISLIGFAGAPWTILSYLYGDKKHFAEIRKTHLQKKYKTQSLLKEITEFTCEYLVKQIESGVDVVQLFDSNASVLPVSFFMELVVEPTKHIVSHIKRLFPTIEFIGFPKGIGVMYPTYERITRVSVTSIDYSVPISWAKDNLRGALQGNLDPFLLAYDIDLAIRSSKDILRTMVGRDFIFNLGHGMLPETPVDNVRRIVDLVKAF